MRRRGQTIAWCVGGLLLGAALHGADRFALVWPTSGTAWAEGKSSGQWLQHAGSGDPASGGFGGVRSGGSHFHEGIDIKAVSRDRRGEPLDSVLAAMAGVVRHVNATAGESGYGRYVVLEHPGLSPAVYTLYAHLARIAPGVRTGGPVAAGQTLGTMGHSSGGYMIPANRSHLHFEIGLAVSQNFESWYASRRFGSRNSHGMWNGLNLVGIDPVAFYNEWRAGNLTSPQAFFARMETAVRLRVATYVTPDFVARYPALLTKPLPLGPVAGWEIRCHWTGLPFAWTPLTGGEVAGLPIGQPRIVEVNAAVLRRERSRRVAVDLRGNWTIGKDLEPILQLLFAAPKKN